MTELKNDTFLRALLREPVDYTPVWMMRQAGRYLPEYRATRARAGSFMQLCMAPELACEVTLQPLERFPLDAAILFSDILTIPDAMGLGLYFADGEGPHFERPVRTAADIERLGVPDPEQDLRYVVDAVALIRRELGGRVPLIGFSGSPWTLATYMVEGGGAKNFSRIKAMMYDRPDLLHALLALPVNLKQGSPLQEPRLFGLEGVNVSLPEMPLIHRSDFLTLQGLLEPFFFGQQGFVVVLLLVVMCGGPNFRQPPCEFDVLGLPLRQVLFPLGNLPLKVGDGGFGRFQLLSRSLALFVYPRQVLGLPQVKVGMSLINCLLYPLRGQRLAACRAGLINAGLELPTVDLMPLGP